MSVEVLRRGGGRKKGINPGDWKEELKNYFKTNGDAREGKKPSD